MRYFSGRFKALGVFLLLFLCVVAPISKSWCFLFPFGRTTEWCRSQFIVWCFFSQDVLFVWNGVCLDSRACLRSHLVKKLITFLNLLPDLCLPGAHVIRVSYSFGEFPDCNLLVLDFWKVLKMFCQLFGCVGNHYLDHHLLAMVLILDQTLPSLHIVLR